MAEFIRARSVEQKQLRMNEIMETTDKLFSNHTYHEITLTTIAEALNWSRGNLYKYVTTKEEIFLELYLEQQQNYFNNVKAVFANSTDFTMETFAELWTTKLDKHRDYLRYYGILVTIIETNVTVERLAEFKKSVMIGLNEVITILEKYCGIAHDEAAELFWTFIFHACGLNNSCNLNPLIKEAMKMAEIPELNLDFVQNLNKFVLMCLRNYMKE